MAPPTRKSKYWLIVLGLLSGAVIGVMVILGYLLLTLPETRAPATSASRPALTLPTAPLPTATSGPPAAPLEIRVAPREPIRGFSNCEKSGFWGMITTPEGRGVAGMQVVVWKDKTGLLSLATTDDQGHYALPLKAGLAPARLWLQVYQNDLAVSAPVQVEIQVDCQNGFQLYQVDWQEVES